MVLAYSFFVGLFVTVVAIAILAKIADRLGIVDHPGPRKIHTTPVPRIGGIAIALSTSVAIWLWLPLNQQFLAFLAGSAIIVGTGIWDDRRPLDYKWKLLGQTLGICILLAGGLHFNQLPFLGLDSVPDYVAYPISFVFLLGVTNAFNLFDGLDGLAGGCIGLSIAAIGVLAIIVGDSAIPVICIALLGGILGFLRFNTYPAAVFMGDAGSQFLGFAAGFLSIYLITDVSPAINPAFPVLALGLPLLDTVSVALRRLLQKRSPFIGDKQHLHHRLLARGLSHVQTVSFLYALQIVVVIIAFFTRYQSDLMLLSLFGLFGLAIFGPLYWLEKADLRLRPTINGELSSTRPTGYLSRKITPLVNYGSGLAAGLILLFLVIGAVVAKSPSRDIAVLCLSVAFAAVFGVIFMKAWRSFFIRLSAYLSCAVVCFLLIKGGAQATIWENWQVNLYLAGLGGLVILCVVFTRGGGFQLSPQDLLMMLLVVTVPNLNVERYFDFPLGIFLLQVSLLFYAIEYIIGTSTRARWVVPFAATLGLLIVSATGFV